MKITRAVLLSILLAALAACTSSATKLSWDTIDGNLGSVKKRVKAGGNVNEFDKWGWSALHWAVYYRSMPIAKFLLENGADPSLQTTEAYGSMKAGCTPLMIAAYYGLPDFAELLLQHGAKTDVTDDNGMTATDYARRYQYTNVVELLENAKKR